MEIHFTKHAKEKFTVLLRHGVKISESRVLETVRNPDLINRSRLPLLIAQGNLDKDRVLRVVYKKNYDLIIIITFYPGRKSQYEK
jgi:hypothetical protein